LPLTTVHKPRKAPVVLNQEEVVRLLEAAPGLKYKAAFGVAYGAGLRVSEVVALKVSDIDSKRMTLRVEQGKGQRDRYVMLSPQLLEWLREWWRAARPQAWLFPGQNPVNPMSARQLSRAVHRTWPSCCSAALGDPRHRSPLLPRERFSPWEAFGRRPPGCAAGRVGAGVRNPSPKRPFPKARNCDLGWRIT
jgi:integrase